MNILLSFNENYVKPTKVMLYSLLENNSEDFDIYVLYFELSSQSMAYIKDLQSRNRLTFHFIRIQDDAYDTVPATKLFPKEAFVRLLAHQLLPQEVERILWLDGDIIVKGSIHELYHTEFGNSLYVAVKDNDFAEEPFKHKQLGMPLEKEYVNSGVLLMNVAALRESVHTADVLSFIDANRSVLCWYDQDVLNGLYFDRIKVIDPACTYNFQAFRQGRMTDRKQLANVIIVHYISCHKPWTKGYGSLGFGLWWKYACSCDASYRRRYPYMWLKHAILNPPYTAYRAIGRRFPKLREGIINAYLRVTGKMA